MKSLLIIFTPLLLLNCQKPETMTNADATLYVNEKAILFVKDDVLYNIQGQKLSSFENNQLLDLRGKPIATITDGQVVNNIDQKLGSINGEELLGVNDKPIARVTGNSLDNKTKVAAGFIFFLQ